LFKRLGNFLHGRCEIGSHSHMNVLGLHLQTKSRQHPKAILDFEHWTTLLLIYARNDATV
jgi:hypothetical protein